MPPLKNNRHERFAGFCFQGMAQSEAYVNAGFKSRGARANASRLIAKDSIWQRIQELHKETHSAAVMPVRERKERLSELSRANIPDFIDGDGIKVSKESPNVGAVSEITSSTRLFRKRGEPVVITRLKLHDPVKSIAELNKMEGEYPPSNVLKVEVEPGKNMEKILTDLLAKLRGYGNKDEG